MPDWLRQRAKISPDNAAIIFGEQVWSFAELDARADVSAVHLAGLGVKAGDRVALLAGNSAIFAQVVFGAVRAGAVLVPLNLRLTAEEIRWQLEDCQPALLVTDRDEWVEGARPLPPSGHPLPEGEGHGLPLVVSLAEVAARPLPHPLTEGEGLQWKPDEADVQAIMYTSGTSGRPKGAMLTYGNFFWSAFGSMAQLGVRDDDRWLACLPLFHVGGLSILFRSVLNGTTAVIHDAFDAQRANQAIDEGGVTMISVVSTMLLRMLEARGDRPFPPTLRCVLLGGGPVPEVLIEKALRLNIPLAQTYGLTETASQATTLQLSDMALKPSSAGKPLLPLEVRIEREDGTVSEAEEPGEISVRGLTVTPGYWRRPDATVEAIRDGWLHTGDAGYLDAEGFLYVIDRRDDLIVSGGENVYPAEVESVLSNHPGVREAGVFALKDPQWGQSVAAVVCLREGLAVLTENALQVFCRQRLAGYKIPRRIFYADELPRTASGKLLRRELRDRFAGKEAQ